MNSDTRKNRLKKKIVFTLEELDLTGRLTDLPDKNEINKKFSVLSIAIWLLLILSNHIRLNGPTIK
jgi:hypothetical protein